jgi:O-antigen ligase
LLIAVVGLVAALGLSVTRASWVALLISAGLMLLLSARRRTIVLAAACAIPLVIAGLFFLHEKRSVGFFDSKDLSTTWRETVWREGFHLLLSKPRHLLVGVGMDSIKGHWRQWGLFDGGRLPVGHMHSNPLQIALERGVPALLAWLWLLGSYAWLLWRSLRELTNPQVDAERNSKFQILNSKSSWLDRGILLGAFGGLVGFFVSGLVHYNWGDSEVVMIVYFIMGLSVVIERELKLKNLLSL